MRTITPFVEKTKYFLLITILSVLLQNAQAQQASFTGTWKLTEKTNISGTDYANAVPVIIKLTQETGKITIDRTELSTDENTPTPTSTEQLITETGKGTVGTTGDNRKIKTATVLNGKELTETKDITVPASETVALIIKEISILPDDGKTLTLVKTFESMTDPNDKWSAKGIYQKQD